MHTSSLPRIVAHRGASATRTENTIAAFDAAVAQGADAVELDIRWTRDRKAVVYHDPAVVYCGRRLAVSKLAAAEFLQQKAQDGVQVPTLGELLHWAKGKPPLVFDIKDTRREELLVAEVEDHGFHPDSVFSSFRLTVIARIKRRRPEWKTAWIIGNWGSRTMRRALFGAIITRAARWKAEALHLNQQWIEPEVVDRCHEAGLALAAWTVDSPVQVCRFAEYGVDAIITNVPDQARQALTDFRGEAAQ